MDDELVRIVKLLAVWAVELICESVLTAALYLIAVLPGLRPLSGLHVADLRSMLAIVIAVLLFFTTTGFALTTAIGRATMVGHSIRFFPLVASILFVVHSEVAFVVTGGLTFWERRPIQIGGFLLTYLCTASGNKVLRRWSSI